jgi:hypothetical protein
VYKTHATAGLLVEIHCAASAEESAAWYQKLHNAGRCKTHTHTHTHTQEQLEGGARDDLWHTYRARSNRPFETAISKLVVLRSESLSDFVSAVASLSEVEAD